MSDLTSSWQLGAREFGVSRLPYNGLIDEVGFWHKVLSQSEVTSLYNSGAGLAYPFSASAGFAFNQAVIIN